MELSRPGWKQKFDSITVYQSGWRLGGKGASGRGRHERIEEHGLHIWLGFYHNAFRMMRECYDELARDSSSPIHSIEQAFERASLFIVQEPRGDGWLPWVAEFPETDEMPGHSSGTLPSLWQLIVHGLRLVHSYTIDARMSTADLGNPGVSLTPVPEAEPDANPDVEPNTVAENEPEGGGEAEPVAVSLEPLPEPATHELEARVRELYAKFRGLVSDLRAFELAAALELAEELPLDPAQHDSRHHNLIVELIDRAVDRMHQLRQPPDDESDQTRRLWYLTNVMLATVRGLLSDGVLQSPDGLDSIDQYDISEWLIRHGASTEAARCSLVTTLMYDLPFAYRDGDPAKPANSAGAALRGAFQTMFGYSGAIAWKMRAGMGDVIFAPLFEVLERRGVRFEFFHRVEALRSSPDGQRVCSIELSRQARLTDPDAGYRPLRDVKGLPCWPSEPLADQLVDDTVSAEDLESFWSSAPVEKVILTEGHDFDIVVLAIPVGAHPYICGDLLERNPRWEEMVANLGTIHTQAFQLWSSAGLEELADGRPPATTGGYLEPFDTYADMQQLIEREDWGGKVNAIAYFCNVMLTPTELPSRDDRELPKLYADAAKANALVFLREAMAPLWPGGVMRYPTEFRWELLVDDGDPERSGPERFDSQYWRANVNPSDRYVQSLPGTARYRLAPDDTGFDNLVFAGDWTQCGLNSGCVEAAVMSGLLAAAAVERRKPRRPIIGCRNQGAQHVL
jgi:uncharacterized protein with NAD-binding domain and iron-sulfur cluster